MTLINLLISLLYFDLMVVTFFHFNEFNFFFLIPQTNLKYQNINKVVYEMDEMESECCLITSQVFLAKNSM